jgi:hypothetical protein
MHFCCNYISFFLCLILVSTTINGVENCNLLCSRRTLVETTTNFVTCSSQGLPAQKQLSVSQRKVERHNCCKPSSSKKSSSLHSNSERQLAAPHTVPNPARVSFNGPFETQQSRRTRAFCRKQSQVSGSLLLESVMSCI